MLKGQAKVGTEVRREQIIQAALDVIASEGTRGLTTSALAKQVGMSEANLYRHYKNKDEILLNTVDKLGDGLLNNLEAVRNMKTANALLQLKTLFQKHLFYIEENKGIPRLLFSEEIHLGTTAGNDLIRAHFSKAIGTYMAGIESLIKEGQDQNRINKKIERGAIAATLIGLIQITTIKWSLSNFSFSLMETGMRLWKNYEACIAV